MAVRTFLVTIEGDDEEVDLSADYLQDSLDSAAFGDVSIYVEEKS